ncbi:MAG: holo-ACP synthase [Anaerolineaceae bacterium]|nr:holo-ACP synthase [Anaerolineaceae bacterium]
MFERISGIGVDLVSIREIEDLDKRTRGAFADRTFSDMEKSEADRSPDRYSFLAGRFAVKEAVFKAVAHLTPEKTFDFRIVETKRNDDGSPEIVMNAILAAVLKSADVTKLLVSITNHDGQALAQVIAVSECSADSIS